MKTVRTILLMRIGSAPVFASLAVAGLVLVITSMGAKAQPLDVPVMVGGESDFDACASQGVVRGLKASGDGFLAVRSGPGSKHAMRDKVHNGTVLNLCDQRGDWLGVVYSHKTKDCGVGSPWAQRQAYAGPCRAGWVYRRYVGELAG